MKNRFEKILRAEADAILSLDCHAEMEQAVRALVACKGRVFTTGLGKAGYIAKKAASTFSTTGTPSIFLHPADSAHGDVGVVQPGDAVIALSNSGKNREVLETIHFCRHLGATTVIGITASKDNPLGMESDIVLPIGKITEACPLGLTPTASTTAMIVLTDALALLTMEEKNFTKEDFALRNHGGYLGQKSRET